MSRSGTEKCQEIPGFYMNILRKMYVPFIDVPLGTHIMAVTARILEWVLSLASSPPESSLRAPDIYFDSPQPSSIRRKSIVIPTACS